ncbi:hypothetical protein EHO62_19030 [Leptospira kmetyi]|nr:hypothetical protein EHO62_19030 [Leptospira kmetyi]
MTKQGGHEELISLYDTNKQAAIEGGAASQKLWEDSTNKAVEQLRSEGLNISMGGQSQGGFFNDLFNSFQQSMGYAMDGNGGLDENGAFSISTCFTAGTLIHTKTGTKKIEEIAIGDQVLSWDEESGERSYKTVTELFVHDINQLFDVEVNENETFHTTWNHPFWVVNEQAWVQVKDLKVGDIVQLKDGSEVPISKISSYSVSMTKVYNLEIEENHTYYVGKDGVLVHNYDYAATQKLATENGYVNGTKTYVDENGHTVISKTMGDKGIVEVVDMGGGNKVTRLVEVDEYGLVRKQEFNTEGKLIESKTSYVQDGILENLIEVAGHLTTGLPATIVSGLGAFLDLTLGNGIVAAHNIFTNDQNDWKYAVPYFGGPNGENDFIGIANSSLPAIVGSRGMGGGPFAFFNSNQGSYQDQFHNNWGTQEGNSAKPLATHEIGHVTQSWNLFQNPLAFFYPLYAPMMTKYNNQNNAFEKQADKIGENNSAKERAKALEAIFGGYRP